MPLIDLIAGARPNFVKIAPIIRALTCSGKSDPQLQYRLVHTGQHYDSNMSGSFFEQLRIPNPDINFDVSTGSHAEQTADIMVQYEKHLLEKPCDLCLVVGDVTSTMASTIAAKKLSILVAHVEGGIRSGDWSMPEEINRMVTDAISDFYFTTSDHANQNLLKSGVGKDRIHFVGNTMIDTLLHNYERLRPPRFWQEYALEEKKYFVLTLHRPANVDNYQDLEELLRVIDSLAQGLTVIFPVHPRTANVIEKYIDPPGSIKMVKPQPYLEFNYLVKHAFAVITDSGGITEEATVMGVPCLTLRDNTERPETVEIGTNELVGTDPSNLFSPMERLFSGEWKKGAVPEKWDGKAGERIVKILGKILL